MEVPTDAGHLGLDDESAHEMPEWLLLLAATVLGAVLALVGGMVAELWRLNFAARGAARVVRDELLFHEDALGPLAKANTPAELSEDDFPASAWYQHKQALMAGVREERALDLRTWYYTVETFRRRPAVDFTGGFDQLKKAMDASREISRGRWWHLGL